MVQTYWKKTGTDGEYSGTFSGATPFTADSMPEGTTFIPFNELTEADVLEWIKTTVVGASEAHVNSVIIEEIERSKNPVVEARMPWAPSIPPASNTEAVLLAANT